MPGRSSVLLSTAMPELPKRYLPRRSQRILDLKKKTLKTYICHVPTVLDNLPLHVISYKIFPYLDYQTRINLNVCLPPWDRVRIKMPSESIKKHETNRCVAMVGSMLESLEKRDLHTRQWIYSGDRRIQRMIQMLSLFFKDEYFFIYTHFPNFRDAFLQKINQMRDLATSQVTEDMYSRTWLDELISLCDTLRNKIFTHNGKIIEGYRLSKIPSLSFT
jgi:hypothetical protein